jgi:LacI family transcriptional regulator
MPKSLTLRDVARRAGVSHTTVSMALCGSTRVAAATAETIRKLAREMDYQPRVAAQLLRGRRTGQVGLLFTGGVEAAETGFTGPILGQFIKACESDGLRYHIEFLDPDNDANGAPYQFTSGLVDGALVAGWVNPAVRKWLGDHPHYPWVSVDEPAQYAVTTAADEGVYQALRHLAALGHRRLVYCGGPNEYLTHRLGREGLQKAVVDFRLTLCDVFATSFSLPHPSPRDEMQMHLSWAQRVLCLADRPTAAVCHGVDPARALIYAAMQMGLRIPQDLSIISYGTGIYAEKSYPSLSCIEPDFAAVVRQSLAMLQRRLAGRSIDQRTLAIPPRLVLRDTVSGPP